VARWLVLLGFGLALGLVASESLPAQEPAKAELLPEPKEEGKADPADAPVTKKQLEEAVAEAKKNGDIAWMLVSSALVMFMVPGLALFYGGMVRRKNILATMMQSMVALSVVGVYWIAVGYSLAFGESHGGWIGWSDKLVFLKGIEPGETLANTNIPIYLHVMFQGMFAIITPALISGAIAERIRFGPYCLFLLLWVTLVYCPLAHWVWAMNWWGPVTVTEVVNGVSTQVVKDPGTAMVGWLGAKGALDFAGGTVVHIAAGLSGLASILVLRKRLGYPETPIHPSSMVLTLLGAGLLWFGWFGFNGGSAVASGALATSAFSATQAAAAAAGLSWMVAEWLYKGKPTALGLASGIVAGLVAVTPASGYVYIWGGLIIGLIAGVVCYAAVCLKGVFGYDDSLDAFGVHGVGGFLGAVLTGVFCYKKVNEAGADGLIATGGETGQVVTQVIAAGASVIVAFVATLVLVKLVDVLFGFVTDPQSEVEGLDRTEHGEVGFDLGPTMEVGLSTAHTEPRPATVPSSPGGKRFSVVVEGATNGDLMHAWSQLCQPHKTPPPPEFKAVYPYVTTVQGNRFRFRGGDPTTMRENLQKLFESRLNGSAIRVHVES
jgi:ammonium transporter